MRIKPIHASTARRATVVAAAVTLLLCVALHVVAAPSTHPAAPSPACASAHCAPAQTNAAAADSTGVAWLFDTSNFPPRWRCGTWSAELGWLHIISDLTIWLAYLAIPASLLYFARRRKDVPFKPIVLLFATFIVACGTTHLLEAFMFWTPAYRLLGVVKLFTACVSIATVIALIPVIPKALALRSPAEADAEIERQSRGLREALANLRKVIEAAPNGMMMVDPDGKIALVNAQIEQMFGYDRNELLGRDVEILLPQRFREAHVTFRQDYLALPATREMGAGRDLFGLHKLGQEFPLEIGLSPVVMDDKMYVLSAIGDITERVESRKRIERYMADLVRSNEELEQFAYVASHDLQEPLRKVASCVQVLAEDYGPQLDDKAREWIGYAVDGAQRMRQLIADLLMYSRVGTRGKPPMPVDAGEACRIAIDALGAAIEESAARVRCGNLPLVIADDIQLSQLFQNLIGNAIKYRGEASPVVEIGSVSLGDKIEFYITDNGIGIDPKFHDRIFEIFQRLHTKEKFSGTGIGLAICKKIVCRMGGEIWVDSQLGQGSTFRFTLPAAEDTAKNTAKNVVEPIPHQDRRPSASQHPSPGGAPA